jgi:cell division protein FtsI (penicillin-binding protein 3)/stage V sporulation protein D (sporulation-specific penicillin-binding protein)
VTIAEKLGSTELADWIARFGFGKTTGLDFPGESPGQVLPLDRWSGSTIGNVPIGQGIAVTPMQMAAAYAAIANGGVWVEPHLVDRVGGRVNHPRAHRRIVSRPIDAQLKAMLTNVVDEHGATGNEAQIAGYTVAGKTGTAQKPGPNGYTTGKYVASFVGMVPVSKPPRRAGHRRRAARLDLRRRGRGPPSRRSPSSISSTSKYSPTRR